MFSARRGFIFSKERTLVRDELEIIPQQRGGQNESAKLELAVIALFECIEQIRRRMRLAIIFNLFIAFELYGRAVV